MNRKYMISLLLFILSIVFMVLSIYFLPQPHQFIEVGGEGFVVHKDSIPPLKTNP